MDGSSCENLPLHTPHRWLRLDSTPVPPPSVVFVSADRCPNGHPIMYHAGFVFSVSLRRFEWSGSGPGLVLGSVLAHSGHASSARPSAPSAPSGGSASVPGASARVLSHPQEPSHLDCYFSFYFLPLFTLRPERYRATLSCTRSIVCDSSHIASFVIFNLPVSPCPPSPCPSRPPCVCRALALPLALLSPVALPPRPALPLSSGVFSL